MVIVPPPSMTVSLSVGSSMVPVTVMVAGAAPQSKVTVPPAVSAAESSASVHEEGVPVPTTAVGWLVSAAPMGAVQTGLGGGTLPASTFGGGWPPASTFGGGLPPESLPGPPPSDAGFVAPSPASGAELLLDEAAEPQPTDNARARNGSVGRISKRYLQGYSGALQGAATMVGVSETRPHTAPGTLRLN